jgi:glycolate oxidase FAD binding subunit
MTAIVPDTIAELQDAIRSHARVRLRGGGTKSPPAVTGLATWIGLRQLSGVLEYTSEECVFTALAGTPVAAISALLATRGQYLPFDPPLAEAGATIGGTVAAGVAGASRYRYGGVRDFIIGVRVIDGEGRLIRAGGKVVKNAAGFLLHHAVVGSAGRFGAIVETTFKVFPVPEARATVRVDCGSATAAFELARTLEAARADLEALDFDGRGTMWIRVAGRRWVLGTRVERLRHVIGRPCEVLHDADDARVWDEAREFLWAKPADSIVKVPLAGIVPFAAATRYTCAGAVAWVASAGDVQDLAAQLRSAGLRGVVVRGADAGTRIGAVEHNPFEERVRRVLDPGDRFRAASHPDR